MKLNLPGPPSPAQVPGRPHAEGLRPRVQEHRALLRARGPDLRAGALAGAAAGHGGRVADRAGRLAEEQRRRDPQGHGKGPQDLPGERFVFPCMPLTVL